MSKTLVKIKENIQLLYLVTIILSICLYFDLTVYDPISLLWSISNIYLSLFVVSKISVPFFLHENKSITIKLQYLRDSIRSCNIAIAFSVIFTLLIVHRYYDTEILSKNILPLHEALATVLISPLYIFIIFIYYITDTYKILYTQNKNYSLNNYYDSSVYHSIFLLIFLLYTSIVTALPFSGIHLLSYYEKNWGYIKINIYSEFYEILLFLKIYI